MNSFKINKDIKVKIIDAVYRGATYKLACDYAGLSYFTFIKWISTEDANAFIIEIKKIELERYAKLLKCIQKAALTDFQALQWLQDNRQNLIIKGLNYDR